MCATLESVGGHVCKKTRECSVDMQLQEAIGGTEYTLAKSRTNEEMQHGDTAEMNAHHVTVSLRACMQQLLS